MNYISQIYDAMFTKGIEFCGEIEPVVGKWQRFYSYNKEYKNSDVFVCIKIPGKLALYGDWNLSDKPFIWRGEGHKLSDQELKVIKERALVLQRKEQIAIQKCQQLWSIAKEAYADHPYILKKQIYPYYIKQFNSTLLIPIRNISGELISLQAIYRNGFKKIHPDTSYKNGFLFLGDALTSPIRLCEGYATGMSIHMATDDLIAVCFAANNLRNVAIILKQRFPKHNIEICCDNDQYRPANKGMIEGMRAASAIGAIVRCPNFDMDRVHWGTDYNDLHILHGLSAVQGQLYSQSFRTDDYA